MFQSLLLILAITLSPLLPAVPVGPATVPPAAPTGCCGGDCRCAADRCPCAREAPENAPQDLPAPPPDTRSPTLGLVPSSSAARISLRAHNQTPRALSGSQVHTHLPTSSPLRLALLSIWQT